MIQFTYKLFFTRSLQPFNWQMYRTIIKILSIHDHSTSWLLQVTSLGGGLYVIYTPRAEDVTYTYRVKHFLMWFIIHTRACVIVKRVKYISIVTKAVVRAFCVVAKLGTGV